VSSAILLAAIVAIWACALVPRWVRRAHEGPPEQEAQEPFETEEAYPEDSPPGTYEIYGAEQTCQVERNEDGIRYQEEVSYSIEVTGTAEVTEPSEPVTRSVPASDPARGRPAARQPGGHPVRPFPAADPASRSRALRARRRTLTMLVTLVIATVGARVAGLADSWIIIPPVVMLSMYLLVLRAAVHADAENAARRAAAHARTVDRSRAAAAATSARAAAAALERAREAAEAAMPQPTAEVIDISARAAPTGDQLYDQYEDATARAIGD
jgi:hypothetical protein